MTIKLISGRVVGTTLALTLLTGCGGGGGDDQIIEKANFAAFNDSNSQESATISAASLSTAGRDTNTLTGTFDRARNRIDFGDLTGTINSDRTIITLDEGGTITLDAAGQLYSALYDATPRIGDRTIGVIGAVTPTPELPSGVATYRGISNVTIQNGVSIYDVSGDSLVSVNFSQSGNVTTTLSNLDGTLTNGPDAPTTVDDIATISITASNVSGSTFKDGDASIISEILPEIGTEADTSASGVFFGPEGQEVGGVLSVDDTESGGMRIFADFIAR